MRKSSAGIAAMLLSAAAGLVIGLYAGRAHPVQAQPMEADTVYDVAQNTSTAAKPRYRLGEKDGKLAVYIIGKIEPEIIFDIYLHHLPDVDRLRLEKVLRWRAMSSCSP
jgi:hypothetical protein